MKLKSLLIISLILLFSVESFSQSKTKSKKKSQNRKEDSRVFGSNDEDFDVTTFPNKWKDESAIVLCQKYDFSYLRSGINNIYFKETLRKRIFINDENAKDEFSIFYYKDNLIGKDYIGFIVVKPDGTKNKVNLDDAVLVAANEVPSSYRSYYSYKSAYKKIAIPNLEVGDIIDYYFSGQSEYKVDGIYSYAPFSFSLADDYPILKQKFYFNVDAGFKVAYRSFNDAPDIQSGRSGVNKQGKTKDNIHTYSIEDENRDKYEPEYWQSRYLSEPTIKFQVRYVPKAKVTRTHLLITEADLINEPFPLKEFKTRIPKDKSVFYGNIETVQYMKKYHKKEKDPIKKADLAYYYLRYYFYNTAFNHYSTPKEYYRDGYIIPVGYMKFTNTYAAVLKALDISYKYVIAVDNIYGGFDNVLFNDELTTGIKVRDKYYFYFDNCSTSDIIPPLSIGSEAIEFTHDGKESTPFRKSTIPVPTYEDNNFTSKMTVSFNETMDTTNIESVDVFKGLQKRMFNQEAIFRRDYMDEDRQKFDPKYAELKARSNKGKQTRLSKNSQLKKEQKERQEADKIKEDNEARNKVLIAFFEGDYEVNKVHKFEIASDGRMPANPNIIVKENYDVEELIHKAGRNYIFNIGNLIGSQLELAEEDMKRRTDIYLNYPKQYNYEIEIIIPEGYKVEDVSALNYEIINESGEFVSTAKIEGNKIILTTSKSYKALYSPKENWQNFIDFLEAAFEFSQKKVIIKKA